MPIEQDLIAHFQSITDQLMATKDRVRDMIGAEHWLSDGNAKESVLRNVLRKRVPRTFNVRKGFVIYPPSFHRGQHKGPKRHSSGEIDVLITPAGHPTLYQDEDDDIIYVTADAVEVVIEVKTLLRHGLFRSNTNLPHVLRHLADKVEGIRKSAHRTDGRSCWAGLFVYEANKIDHRYLLSSLQQAANNIPERIIDCVSIGPNLFAHFWGNGRQEVNGLVEGGVWHSYTLERLAPAYFISNVVAHVSPPMPEATQRVWFPIEGGKESFRQYYIPMESDVVEMFPEANNARGRQPGKKSVKKAGGKKRQRQNE